MYLDVVEYGRGDVGVQVNQPFLLQQLRQRAAGNITSDSYTHFNL